MMVAWQPSLCLVEVNVCLRLAGHAAIMTAVFTHSVGIHIDTTATITMNYCTAPSCIIFFFSALRL